MDARASDRECKGEYVNEGEWKSGWVGGRRVWRYIGRWRGKRGRQGKAR